MRLLALSLALLGVSAASLFIMAASTSVASSVPGNIRQRQQQPQWNDRNFPLTQAEYRLVRAVNAYREQRGLRSLRVNPILMETARGRDHATVRTSHHVNGQWPWDAAKSHGYRGYATENLAWGYSSPEEAVGQPLGSRGGWQTSPGHAKAMRGNFSEIGVAVRGRTYVAMFGRPSNGGR